MSRVYEALPVRTVAEIQPRPATETWLIDQLWVASGVGIIGGQPKTFKTWLATEIALAVATGGQALGQYQTKTQGSVLVFAAEDNPPAMKARFEAVAEARGLKLDGLPIYLIDVPSLRLDRQEDVGRLRRTIERHRPRLLILDPFVRLVRLDENSAQDVSAVLGELRALQRTYDLAVILTHHMRKSSSTHPGQQLRGSGDFAAWTDSALYITRQADDRLLTAEHRSAPAPEPFLVRLELAPAPHLVVKGPTAVPAAPADPLHAAIIRRLTVRPCSTQQLREQIRVRKSTLLKALSDLSEQGRVNRDDQGWMLVADSA